MRCSHGLLALSLVSVAGCAGRVETTPVPAPQPGGHIRFSERSDPARFTGARRLVALDADSLRFERYAGGLSGRSGQWSAGSLPTDSLSQLQVRTRRAGNAGWGALFGALAGLGPGIACGAEEGDWVSPGQCILGFTALGAVSGLVVGALIKSDVWAPILIPARSPIPPAPAPAPPVSTRGQGTGLGIGVRLPGH